MSAETVMAGRVEAILMLVRPRHDMKQRRQTWYKSTISQTGD
jgi:hypothetical protein